MLVKILTITFVKNGISRSCMYNNVTIFPTAEHLMSFIIIYSCQSSYCILNILLRINVQKVKFLVKGHQYFKAVQIHSGIYVMVSAATCFTESMSYFNILTLPTML